MSIRRKSPRRARRSRKSRSRSPRRMAVAAAAGMKRSRSLRRSLHGGARRRSRSAGRKSRSPGRKSRSGRRRSGRRVKRSSRSRSRSMRGGARRGHKKSHSASPHKKGYSPYLTHGAAALGGAAALMGVNKYRSGKFYVPAAASAYQEGALKTKEQGGTHSGWTGNPYKQ